MTAQRGELIALPGGPAALLIHAAPGVPIAQAQQLVKDVEQLIAAPDHQRVHQRQRQRVSLSGFQPA